MVLRRICGLGKLRKKEAEVLQLRREIPDQEILQMKVREIAYSRDDHR